MRRQIDRCILEMALVGYESERQEIANAMAAIQKQLGGRATKVTASKGAKPKRHLSAAALRRISAAQKKRWAAFHKSKAEKPAPAKKVAKKKMSAERRAALVANLAKARAARAAKKAATA
jgi:hypothetical protein